MMSGFIPSHVNGMSKGGFRDITTIFGSLWRVLHF